jgi:hypothetical protein
MRRKEFEISDRAEIEEIIKSAEVCRLGLSDNGMPYIVPLNFGYREGTLYIHCAPKGRKLDILKENDNVCVEFEGRHELIKADKACDWSAKYSSVIGFGKGEIVTDPDGKREGLEVLMSQYSDRDYEFSDDELKTVSIIKVTLHELTGKKRG